MSEVHAVRDVAVVGTGPSGLVAALALAHVGAEVVAIGPAPGTERSRGRDANGGAAHKLGRSPEGSRCLGEARGRSRAAEGHSHHRCVAQSLARAGHRVQGERARACRLRLQHRQHHSHRCALCPRAGDLARGHRGERHQYRVRWQPRRVELERRRPPHRAAGGRRRRAGVRSAGFRPASASASGATIRARSPQASAIRFRMRTSRPSCTRRKGRSPPCPSPTRMHRA